MGVGVGVGVGVCLPWQAALAGYKQVDFVGVSVGVWVCGCVLTVASRPGRLLAGRFCVCVCVCAYRGKLPWQATSR